ncbi:LAT2 domain-containing protein isoform X2 [Megalobrama amblycephala]|uniref:LAT2 domain-containing protein isoform X2 n=1 Tax=Megalobrama amblycephala TaxID=75352 RepID=UPI002013D1DB|nr:LAT2 domain-containing protein isoform X2 [Megalobrama amblycephala]
MILHGCGESQFETGNTQVHFALSLVLQSTSSEIHQNGDRYMGKGMIEVQSQQGVLLAIISLACLGCIYALCLWCRKRSTVRQEDNDLYDQDHFIDGNSDNKEYKAVIRPNQSKMPSTSRQSTANRPVNSDIHWSYQNIRDEQGFLEPTYVDPIPNSVYANDDDAGKMRSSDTFSTEYL